jgi:hypothetical protein
VSDGMMSLAPLCYSERAMELSLLLLVRGLLLAISVISMISAISVIPAVSSIGCIDLPIILLL